MVAAGVFAASASVGQEVVSERLLVRLPETEGFEQFQNARAGVCCVIYPDTAIRGWRVVANGKDVDQAALIEWVGFSRSGQWYAYWRLDRTSKRWQLALRSLDGEVQHSDWYDVLCYQTKGGLSTYLVEEEVVRRGPTRIRHWAVENDYVVSGLNVDWEQAAWQYAAVSEGAAYFLVGQRGPKGDMDLPTIEPEQLAVVGEQTEVPEWDTAEPEDVWAGPNTGLAFRYERQGQQYLWVNGSEVSDPEAYPAEPAVSCNGQHWTAASVVDGQFVLYLDSARHATSVRVGDEDSFWVYPPSDDGRVAFFSITHEGIETLFRWSHGETQQLLETSGSIVTRVVCSADGSRWVAAVWEEQGHCVWNTGQRLELEEVDYFQELQVTPEGDHWFALLWGGEGEQRLLMDGKPVDLDEKEPMGLWVGGNGRVRVITFDGYLLELKLPGPVTEAPESPDLRRDIIRLIEGKDRK